MLDALQCHTIHCTALVILRQQLLSFITVLFNPNKVFLCNYLLLQGRFDTAVALRMDCKKSPTTWYLSESFRV